jgi:hypothetical protein
LICAPRPAVWPGVRQAGLVGAGTWPGATAMPVSSASSRITALTVVLPRLNPAAGQLPPDAQLGIPGLAGMQEQHVIERVHDHSPHDATLDDFHR